MLLYNTYRWQGSRVRGVLIFAALAYGNGHPSPAFDALSIVTLVAALAITINQIARRRRR